MRTIYSIIKGTGSFIPSERVVNADFLDHEYYDASGNKLDKDNTDIIEKFKEITTIEERRHVTDDLTTSDIAFFAAQEALKDAGTDIEQLDYIIVAHNFGDITVDNKDVNIVPSIAARVKYKLQIHNPNCVAYDVLFGCPGWVQTLIQANYYIKSGDAKRILIIGAEILSRVSDPHDRDSMLYADGAGAVVLEAVESDTPVGVLAHATRSDTFTHSQMLFMGKSYKPNLEDGDTFLKMNGRRLYQYALETVPYAVKACLDKINVPLSDIKKVLIHQANGKMDDAILQRLFQLYGTEDVPENIMPMTIDWLGNSSVATIPTLLDLLSKGKLKNHKISSGDTLILASVGAGMNINVVIYKLP